MAEWISVKERLPEIGLDVLVYCKAAVSDFSDIIEVSVRNMYKPTPWLEDRPAERVDQVADDRDLGVEVGRRGRPVRLVVRGKLKPVRGFPAIEDERAVERVGGVVGVELEQELRHGEDRVGRRAVVGREHADREVAAEDLSERVDQENGAHGGNAGRPE